MVWTVVKRIWPLCVSVAILALIVMTTFGAEELTVGCAWLRPGNWRCFDMGKRLQWRHKDSSRYEWIVVTWPPDDPSPSYDGNGTVWAYEIYREGVEQPVHFAGVYVQTGCLPKLQDLMLDWMNYVNMVGVTACQFATFAEVFSG